jgi:hypothetical protein
MTKRGDEVTEREKENDRKARQEQIDRLWEEFHALQRENRAIFDRWRAEGILPPEEPRRRF